MDPIKKMENIRLILKISEFPNGLSRLGDVTVDGNSMTRGPIDFKKLLNELKL